MIQRHLAPAILAALKDTPVVLIVGPRQAGKSTLAQWLAAEKHPARYLTLDNASVLTAAQADPTGFVGALEGPVVVDEVQRVPELFLAIKASVDRDRRAGRFLLTGSANVLLLPRLSESLVGRMEVLTLWPLSQGEIEGVKEGFVDAVFGRALTALSGKAESWSELVGRVLRGGYPEVLARDATDRRRAWFGSYVTTILDRDIRDISGIEGLTAMPPLLTLLATRSTALLNYADLSRGLGMPQSTLKRYMALFETTFLIQTVRSWQSNLGKRLLKTPKVVLTDAGLMAHLLGLSRERLMERRDLAGPLVETFVLMELRKQAVWSERHPHILHFRTQTGQEVDIVLEDPAGRIVGVEVKASATIGSEDFKGLRELSRVAGKHFHRGIVLYDGAELLPFGPRLYALPISALWRLDAQKAPPV
jgi:predicted AAA+ superfamily ATPase